MFFAFDIFVPFVVVVVIALFEICRHRFEAKFDAEFSAYIEAFVNIEIDAGESVYIELVHCAVARAIFVGAVHDRTFNFFVVAVKGLCRSSCIVVTVTDSGTDRKSVV